jgi:hypothetical protein
VLLVVQRVLHRKDAAPRVTIAHIANQLRMSCDLLRVPKTGFPHMKAAVKLAVSPISSRKAHSHET